MAKGAQPKTPEERVTDPASLEVLKKAEAEAASTCFIRLDAQAKQCRFGDRGLCCRICYMGPCRITPKSPHGICGADADTVVARNFLRELAGGAAAHSDHGRHLALMLARIAEGNGGDYEIRDERALRRNARKYGIEEVGRSKEDVARRLAGLMIEECMIRCS